MVYCVKLLIFIIIYTYHKIQLLASCQDPHVSVMAQVLKKKRKIYIIVIIPLL